MKQQKDYCGIGKEDNDDVSNDDKYNKIETGEYSDLDVVSDGDGDVDNDNDNDDKEDENEEDEYYEYYDTKPYNDRFLEAMHNTEGFRKHCDIVDKSGEWIEEFRE